jgi:hypothetical protein
LLNVKLLVHHVTGRLYKVKGIIFQRLSQQKEFCTVCPTRHRTRHFFNNSNTNEDIATKFEQGYVRCVRNEVDWVLVRVCSAPNCCDTEQRSASQPGSVASGTPCINFSSTGTSSCTFLQKYTKHSSTKSLLI